MAYKAPIWEDGKSPAISADNLNNLSQAAEGAQVLYGNSAPTSSTEGAVGQFYLVVVADSDGNYPLYQCVAIANGSYTWRDTRRIPDSITSMLGIPAPGTINRALNVLANVGNLHVWERVQTYAEPVPEVPAGYTLGEVETDTLIVTGTSSTRYIYFYTATSPTVDNNGNVSIPTTTTQSSYKVSVLGDSGKILNGPFFFVLSSDTVGIVVPEVVYIPAGATMYCDSSYTKVYISKLQRVIGYPYTPAIPAGTTTDYLTSTDRNAYTEGTVDSTTITYLGQLGGGARIEVGSYVGTGTYGSSNPNSLTFGFEPKVFMFDTSYTLHYGGLSRVIFDLLPTSEYISYGYPFCSSGSDSGWAKKSTDGKTLFWYNSSDSSNQMNYSGKTYYYIAIG